MRGNHTPNEIHEIWRRSLWQFERDGVCDVIKINDGMSDYLVRQILYYAGEVERDIDTGTAAGTQPVEKQ